VVRQVAGHDRRARAADRTQPRVIDLSCKVPTTMLRLMTRKFAEQHSADELGGVVRKAKAIETEAGSLAAVDYLVRQIGFEMPPERDAAYFTEALNFQLGALEACAGRPESMARHIQLSRTMPGPEDQCLYSDHVMISQATRDHQRRAIARAIPAIVFACMPRSGSATLTHSLAKLLDAPIEHICLGEFPDNYFVVPSWLDMFLEGGAVTQDHFTLNDFNRGVLSARGRRDIFVTIRDPRAAASSHVHMRSALGYRGSGPLEQRIERECLNGFIPWLQSWIHCAQDRTLPFRIHLIKFADAVRDLTGTVRKIARTLQEEYPAMARYAECGAVEEIRVHFVRGDDEAWRSEVGEATAAKLWDAMTADIRQVLNLTR